MQLIKDIVNQLSTLEIVLILFAMLLIVVDGRVREFLNKVQVLYPQVAWTSGFLRRLAFGKIMAYGVLFLTLGPVVLRFVAALQTS